MLRHSIPAAAHQVFYSRLPSIIVGKSHTNVAILDIETGAIPMRNVRAEKN